MNRLIALILLLAVSVLTLSSAVNAADEHKVVGIVTQITLSSPDGAVVILKDNATSEELAIVITDEQTVDKFKDHRIVEGDEIRCKFVFDERGVRLSKYFRKTAGC